MKTLIVFYSRTGNIKRIANEIARKLKADVDEIKSVSNYNGFFGYLRAGYQSSAKKNPMIHTEKYPGKYQLIVIGSPTWSWGFSSPVRSYIAKNKLSLKKAAFFFTSGGPSIKNAIKEIKELNLGNKILHIRDMEIKQNSYKNKLNKFCKDLI